MGCCVSTLDEKNKAKLQQQDDSLSKNGHFSCVSKSPPRPDEEETVKEVLSETPKPKPRPKPDIEPGVKVVPKCENEAVKVEEKEVPTKCKLVGSPKKPYLVQKLPSLDKKLPSLEQKLPSLEQNVGVREVRCSDTTPPDEEISEVSEMCSLSESISTTTLEEQLHQQQQWAKDCANSGEVRQKMGVRSQGQNGHFRHGRQNFSHGSSGGGGQNVRNHGRSPVRRADPSPPRRRFPGPGSGPNSGSGQVGPRRDVVGENSARRSRSPAMRSNVGRSPSARKTGPSPGRVRMVHGPGPENGRNFEEKDVNGNGNRNRAEEGNGNGNEWEVEGPKESLENPLVSLECFIFL